MIKEKVLKSFSLHCSPCFDIEDIFKFPRDIRKISGISVKSHFLGKGTG